jgi:hypothetical protein
LRNQGSPGKQTPDIPDAALRPGPTPQDPPEPLAVPCPSHYPDDP